ncbi:MAG: amidohydrolase family protein [Egibacteraceae bacterium]
MSDWATPVRSIECELLFDGYKLVPDAVLEIEDDRIRAVRPRGASVAEPPADPPGGGNTRPREEGTAGVALRARFAMPGLIDSHVHCIGYHEGMPAAAPFKPVKTFLRLCISNGVTTIRDTGNSLETLFYVRDWTRAYPGPRIFGSGPVLDRPPLMWESSRIIRDEVDAKREVGRLADDGVDLIKAYRNITPNLLRPIVESATECGLPVALDASVPAEEASRIGVHSLEHLQNLFVPDRADGEAYLCNTATRVRAWSRANLDADGYRRLVSTLVEHGTYVVPTIIVSRRWSLLDEMVNEPMLDWMIPVMPYHKQLRHLRSPMGQAGRRRKTPSLPLPKLAQTERREVHQGLARMGELLVRLHEAGVRIAAGTDTPNPSVVPGFGLHTELRLMVDAGLPPLATLRAATSSAASLIGRADLGRLEPGAVADVLLLDANPLDDITNLRHIRDVVKNGARIDLADVRRRLEQAVEMAGGRATMNERRVWRSRP